MTFSTSVSPHAFGLNNICYIIDQHSLLEPIITNYLQTASFFTSLILELKLWFKSGQIKAIKLHPHDFVSRYIVFVWFTMYKQSSQCKVLLQKEMGGTEPYVTHYKTHMHCKDSDYLQTHTLTIQGDVNAQENHQLTCQHPKVEGYFNLYSKALVNYRRIDLSRSVITYFTVTQVSQIQNEKYNLTQIGKVQTTPAGIELLYYNVIMHTGVWVTCLHIKHIIVNLITSPYA